MTFDAQRARVGEELDHLAGLAWSSCSRNRREPG
jgi:hypothetical protein